MTSSQKQPTKAEAPKAPETTKTKAPRRIRVWQDTNNAEAMIIAENEDGTLDLLADLFSTGRELTLTGVHKRIGSGNGWEEIVEAETTEEGAA